MARWGIRRLPRACAAHECVADAAGRIRQVPEPTCEGNVDDNSEKRLRTLLVVVLLMIVVSGTVDLILDAPESWRSGTSSTRCS